ncbi:MAG: transporter substrate-binding domain-containing protein [Clostridia bacterium]|nr:transporter substrate-binding domain-containing protein [Clostridia bacterium]
MDFDGLLIALSSGQIDAVIAGMTVTDERAEQVDFSEPYYTATQVMIVPADSTVASAKDIADLRIGVIDGYTGQTCVEELGYKFSGYKKGADAVLDLANGNLDVVVIDSATAEKFIGENKDLKIVKDSETFEDEQYAIAVKKGNKELLDSINKSIKAMKESGEIGEISAKYN